jgi:hypothetical protein
MGHLPGGKLGRTVAEVARELGCDWHTVNDKVIARRSAHRRIGWHRIRTALAAVLGIPFDSVSGSLSGQGEGIAAIAVVTAIVI